MYSTGAYHLSEYRVHCRQALDRNKTYILRQRGSVIFAVLKAVEQN